MNDVRETEQSIATITPPITTKKFISLVENTIKRLISQTPSPGANKPMQDLSIDQFGRLDSIAAFMPARRPTGSSLQMTDCAKPIKRPARSRIKPNIQRLGICWYLDSS